MVLTENEVRHVLAHLDGRNWLMASLLYGEEQRAKSKGRMVTPFALSSWPFALTVRTAVPVAA